MQIFRCLAILRRDNSIGSWVFFIWLSFLPPFSLTAVLPPCEIKKEKKKSHNAAHYYAVKQMGNHATHMHCLKFLRFSIF